MATTISHETASAPPLTASPGLLAGWPLLPVALVWLTTTGHTMNFREMAAERGWVAADTYTLHSSYLIVLGLALLTAPRLIGLYDIRSLTAAGLGLFAVGSAINGFLTTWPLTWCILGRVIAGAGGGLIIAAAPSLLDPRWHGTFTWAGILLPPLGPALISGASFAYGWSSWEGGFLFEGAVAVACLAGLCVLPTARRQSDAGVAAAWPLAYLPWLVMALGCTWYCLHWGQLESWLQGRRVVAALTVGGVSLAWSGWLLWPQLDWTAARENGLRLVLMAYGGVVQFFHGTTMTIYSSLIVNYNTWQRFWLVWSMPIGAALGLVLAAFWQRRRPFGRPAAVLGLLIMAGGMHLLNRLTLGWPYWSPDNASDANWFQAPLHWQFAPGRLLLGFGVALFLAAVNAMVSRRTEVEVHVRELLPVIQTVAGGLATGLLVLWLLVGHQTHYSYTAEASSIQAQEYADRVRELSERQIRAGVPAASANRQALALLYRSVNYQADNLTYADIYGAFCVSSLALALLLAATMAWGWLPVRARRSFLLPALAATAGLLTCADAHAWAQAASPMVATRGQGEELPPPRRIAPEPGPDAAPSAASVPLTLAEAIRRSLANVARVKANVSVQSATVARFEALKEFVPLVSLPNTMLAFSNFTSLNKLAYPDVTGYSLYASQPGLQNMDYLRYNLVFPLDPSGQITALPIADEGIRAKVLMEQLVRRSQAMLAIQRYFELKQLQYGIRTARLGVTFADENLQWLEARLQERQVYPIEVNLAAVARGRTHVLLADLEKSSRIRQRELAVVLHQSRLLVPQKPEPMLIGLDEAYAFNLEDPEPVCLDLVPDFPRSRTEAIRLAQRQRLEVRIPVVGLRIARLQRQRSLLGLLGGGKVPAEMVFVNTQTVNAGVSLGAIFGSTYALPLLDVGLWSRIRQARLDVAQSQLDLEKALIDVAADAGNSWDRWQQAGKEWRQAESELSVRRELLQRLEQLYGEGQAIALEVLGQRVSVLQADATRWTAWLNLQLAALDVLRSTEQLLDYVERAGITEFTAYPPVSDAETFWGRWLPWLASKESTKPATAPDESHENP